MFERMNCIKLSGILKYKGITRCSDNYKQQQQQQQQQQLII